MNKIKSLGLASLIGLSSMISQASQTNTNNAPTYFNVYIRETPKTNGINLELSHMRAVSVPREEKPFPTDEGYYVQLLDKNTNVIQSNYTGSPLKRDLKYSSPDLQKDGRYLSRSTFTNDPAISFVRIIDYQNRITNTSRLNKITLPSKK